MWAFAWEPHALPLYPLSPLHSKQSIIAPLKCCIKLTYVTQFRKPAFNSAMNVHWALPFVAWNWKNLVCFPHCHHFLNFSARFHCLSHFLKLFVRCQCFLKVCVWRHYLGGFSITKANLHVYRIMWQLDQCKGRKHEILQRVQGSKCRVGKDWTDCSEVF